MMTKSKLQRKRKKKQKRSQENLREGRKAPRRRCLHPFCFRFRFRFRLNLFIIRKLAHHPPYGTVCCQRLRFDLLFIWITTVDGKTRALCLQNEASLAVQL